MTQPATGSHAGPGDVAATAGAVVAGGGAVGAWCACFLRLAGLVPVTARPGLRKVRAAAIGCTPGHLPIIGPARTPDGPLPGVTIASAGGHGMMWGPAVARAAVDVALNGTSEVADVSQLGLDRFDDTGHSKLAADPVALPFPQATVKT